MQTELRSGELPKTYESGDVEARIYETWLAAGVFHEEPDPARPAFIISMPPPNITGRAHLGHGSTYTPMDILTRYHRMQGENANWLPGQDHAAIATEAVLVRELAKEGVTRDGLGRQAFIARAWSWREQYGDAIYESFRKLGFGPDWSRDRFTMDPALSAAVIRVFVALYRQGLIYRGTRLINWDPVSKSTLSDAEVEDEERDGFLWHIRYAAEDGSFTIDVATTRPETMLGDTAIAVHPDDNRYAHLVGKRVLVPLVGRAIPVIADAAVERDFGTGAVKVTPAHDPTDNEIGERHGLQMPTVIGFDGKITNEAPERYVGLDRFAARDAIVRDLEASGALVGTTPRRHTVPVSSRSGAIVEPLLSLQWFCKMQSLAEPALAAYRDGRIRFVPERFGRTYEHALDKIKDWNVSRQVWWGHQLPVWYTPAGDPIVAESEEEAIALAREHHDGAPLRRDPDTLDTWFSSGLWPFSILGWPNATPELEHWYPNSVLVTGREIIFLWVARMVMLGMHFAGDVPFKDVFIAPLVFDDKGRKMSKSLGNVIDPMDLVEKFGADATRLGVVLQMRLESQELRFDERLVVKARGFNNKMWNALLYARSLPEGLPGASRLPPLAEQSLADRWLLAHLRATIEHVTKAYENYEFGSAADALLDFIWYRYCDWYIEATKAATPTRAPVLSYAFNAAMRLLHPIAPFITEEIWQALPHDGKTIVTAMWPDPEEIVVDTEAAARFETLKSVVTKVRDLRSELGLPPREKLTIDVPPALDAGARTLLALLAHADVVESPALAGDAGEPLLAATPRAPRGVLLQRARKDVARLGAEVDRLERKLGNEQFTGKASPDVVAKERTKLAAYRAERERAVEQARELSGGADDDT
ncbi:MAG: valine--tRNA ligase [Candidatus Eremiobacteraeota bacterium]|nr:valine--tRNA ligase [Candidatus Eremiobacteraeota bacterium]